MIDGDELPDGWASASILEFAQLNGAVDQKAAGMTLVLVSNSIDAESSCSISDWTESRGHGDRRRFGSNDDRRFG